MKVLFVCWSLGVSGGIRAIFEVANRLDERGYEVSVIALSGDYRWFGVNVPINYVEVSKATINQLVKMVITLYGLVRRGVRRKIHMGEFGGFISRKFKVYVDLVRHLAENLPVSDVYSYMVSHRFICMAWC